MCVFKISDVQTGWLAQFIAPILSNLQWSNSYKIYVEITNIIIYYYHSQYTFIVIRFFIISKEIN